MPSKKIIYAIPPPATGHVNPMCGVVNEICKYPNVEVIFYSDECYREVVEKTGAKFRALSHPTFSKIQVRPITERRMMMGEMMNLMVDSSYDLLPQFISDAEREQPDLILYDCMFMPVKFLLDIIKAREAKGTWNRTVPKTVSFIPNFPMSPSMMKEFRENSQEDFWSLIDLVNAYRRNLGFCWKYGITSLNLIGLFIRNDPFVNVVAVTPEMQPDRETFDDTFKFVGPCVSEEARSVEIKNDDELKNVLELFDSKERSHDLKLIYMSLGTVFNGNSFIFERAFEAVKNFDSGLNRHIKSSQIRMIVSLGDAGYKDFITRIDQGKYSLHQNILLRPKVPQLEVLKRADLFITHCGMNSTTETIKYGVPVVAIPLQADQPMVSKRICDGLSYGLRLDPINFTSKELADAVDRVLSDPKYRTNICEMSKKLNKYNGAFEGARLVIEELNKI